MRRHRIALAVALLFAGSLPLAAAELPSPNDELLYSARLWEARDRGDLAGASVLALATAAGIVGLRRRRR